MDASEREVDLGGGHDGHSRDAARRIGERMLRLDELEETLDLARDPRFGLRRALPALEERVRVERGLLEEMQRREALGYDEIELAMRQIDLSG